MKFNTTHYLLAALVVTFLAGVLPGIIALLGGPELPGAGNLSTPMPVFIISIVFNALVLWHLTTIDRSKAQLEAEQVSKQFEALHDPLTGMANRRYFDVRLNELTSLESPRCALLMIDLDNFKPVNDFYGHAAGDQLLRQVSIGISKLVKQGDVVFRLGGDEFAVILADVDLAAAKGMACEVLDFVCNFRMLWKGNRVQVGTSIGLVMIDQPRLAPSAILEASDIALYAAKEAGRGAAMLIEVWPETAANVNKTPASPLRIDEGVPEATASAASHQPSDGRTQYVTGVSSISPSSGSSVERRTNGLRPLRGPEHLITVEPVTKGDDMLPGMSMRELMTDAEALGDGGADLARWTFAMTLAAAARLRPEELAAVGFVVPIPARAVIAAPGLADELTTARALAAKPIRHLTFVLQNANKVDDQLAVNNFVSRMQVSNIRMAFLMRGVSIDHLSPLIHSPFDEIHIGRELHHNIQPGKSSFTAVATLMSVAANAGARLVASEVDNHASLKSLIHLSLDRISGPIVEPVKPLDQTLSGKFLQSRSQHKRPVQR